MGLRLKFKIMKTTFFKSSLVLALTLGFAACQRDRFEWKDTQTASDSEQAEGIADEAINISDNAARGGSEVARLSGTEGRLDAMSGCATITKDTLSEPKVITIDFGPVNCQCNDGRYRRGKIIVTYSGGRYFDIGSVKTITFDNFFRNDNKVEGVRKVTNNGQNASGQWTWTISAENMKITRPDGTFHTWNSTRLRTMINGYSTQQIWSDDEYTITGSATGVNKNGVAYSAMITTPLHRLMSCRWIDSGVIEITPETGPVRTMDFGNGDCDNLLTVSVGTRSRTIEMN